ncbi:MAG: efflux RND transporter periplasmic adaptor subunit [Phycisphaerales bacterium]|nr:efflux RND transporter periplasmic adaptor subunit [Phycisphaerales bacterium]
MKRTHFIMWISVLLSACHTKQNTSNQQAAAITTNEMRSKLTDAQLKVAKIELGELEEKSISSIIKVNGKIDVPPQNMVSVSMPLGGYLKTTKLLPGMHISKGEVIATMEDQQYIQLQQEYLTAKSKLIYTEAEYNRQKELNQSKASSDKTFQQIQMEYSNQKIALKALGEKLQLININPNSISENNISKSVNIYAPINGFVSKVNVNIGKYLNPADVLFELVNPSDIHLNLMIFEKDLDKLFVGQSLVAYTNNKPDIKHPCEIILISKDLSNERSAEVHCHFEDYDKSLLPGMYMNADIEIISNNTLALPEDAIVNFEGKHYAFIALSAHEFEMTEVVLGAQENGFVEIKNNQVFTQKQIVRSGAYTLLMSLKNKANEE